MGTRTFTYTFTGTEPKGPIWFSAPMPAFTGTYTETWALNAAPGAIINFIGHLTNSTTLSDCNAQGRSFGPTDTVVTVTRQVNNPTFDWACFDWSLWRMSYNSATNLVPAGRVLTVTLSGAGIPDPLGVCAYGTRKKDLTASVIEVTPGLAGGLLTLLEGRWALAGVLVGAVGWVYLDQYCNSPPPADPTLNPEDFLSSPPPWGYTIGIQKLADKFRRSLWEQYCECVPAPPDHEPPTPPAVTIWNQPTWYVSNTVNNISNTDIANTLNLILNAQTTNTYVTNNNAAAIREPSPCPPPAYELGAVHDGLTLSGSWPVDQVVGFRIEVLAYPPDRAVYTGQPPYIWDLGWVSVTHPDGLLDEKRVTRSEMLWFPCSMPLAETFTYSLRSGVTARVTELVRPPEVVLIG